MFQSLAAQDGVIATNFMTAEVAQILPVIDHIGIIERARSAIEGLDLVADIGQHTGDEPQRRSDLQDPPALNHGKQMYLRPLVDDPFAGVISEPCLF
jgi:hypothetical protein